MMRNFVNDTALTFLLLALVTLALILRDVFRHLKKHRLVAHMNPETKKPGSKHVVLATIVPLVLGLWATQVTIHAGERYGWDTIPFVLVGWCALLSISAVYLNRVVFDPTKTLFPFFAAVVVIVLVWCWQRLAFTTLVPRSGLTYGYFLEPNGARAGFWVLTCPLRVGLVCLTLCLATSLVLAWRAGFRGLLACMIPWWLTAFLIFLLPSMYFDAQGNASVFI
jgi:hypothetical protein